MKIVIQVAGMPDGTSTPFDGEFISEVDFEYDNGRGAVKTVKDPHRALQFDGMVEAIEFCKTQPKCKPIRWDGEPNRPLTATNMAFMTVERAEKEVGI